MRADQRVYELRVTFGTYSDHSAAATIWVRLRDGDLHPAVTLDWPAGAPTPSQLELLEASLLDELQKLVLTSVGVQGVLYPTGRE